MYFIRKYHYICTVLNLKIMLEKEKKIVYTIKEFAKILGISMKTAYGIVERKEIASITVGKSTRITSQDLDVYLSKKN